jgi:small-conductance mechanosensitive channel
MAGIMRLPAWVNDAQLDMIMAAVWFAAATLFGLILHRGLFWFFDRWAKRNSGFAGAVVRDLSPAARFIIPFLFVLAVFPYLDLSGPMKGRVIHLTGLLTIASFAWAAIAMIRFLADLTLARQCIDSGDDNLLARGLGTRVNILARTATILITVLALGMMAMTFPTIRAVGTTLLASAGVAGLIVGLASRPLFENLVAGIQLALTQPIRLNDVVVVENQWGRIEEIHSTYVIVRIWDLRRMVVPLTYFINTPFQNWTRNSANLMGEVLVYADWTLDVDALRAEIRKIVEGSPLWDHQFQNLQVTDATDRSIQVRALVTARNSGDLFDLRCYVREKIVAYIRDHQPHAFPRLRVDVPDGTFAIGEAPRFDEVVASVDRHFGFDPSKKS